MKDTSEALNEILQNTAETQERTRQIQSNLSKHQKRYEREMEIHNQRIDRLEIKVERQDVIIAAQLVFATLVLTALLNWAVTIF